MITVLLTGGGCPGARTVAGLLRNNGEREVRIVMTDMRSLAHGRWYADAFHVVPPGASPEFIPALKVIIEQEQVDVVLPQATDELPALVENVGEMGAKVLISSPNAVSLCRHKASFYQFADHLLTQDKAMLPPPRWRLCRRPREFMEAAGALGFPERPVCYKPDVGRGGKGFNVLWTPVQLAKAIEALGDSLPSRPQIVMEYVDGDELRADLLCRNGEALTGFIKRYSYIRDNIGLEFEVVDRPDLLAAAATLARAARLDWLVNMQFRGRHLLEVNPRISTMIATAGYNQPWLAVKLALGLVSKDEVKQAVLPVGSKSVRYWDQVFYGEEG